MSTVLQTKLAAALRREYGETPPAAPAAPVVPSVSVALALPTEAVEVFDQANLRGAFSYTLTVVRDSDGAIKTATWTPAAFIPIEAFS
jgi:hypothetical protein